MFLCITYLKLLMGLEKEHIDGRELCYISMSFELLTHLCTYPRDGHVEGIHRLYFRSLNKKVVRTLFPKASNAAHHVLPVTSPDRTWGPVASHRPNWRLNHRLAKWLPLEEKGRSLHARVLWARYVGLIMLGYRELSSSEVFRPWGRGGELRDRGNLGINT